MAEQTEILRINKEHFAGETQLEFLLYELFEEVDPQNKGAGFLGGGIFA